jgi:hypothetical protein
MTRTMSLLGSIALGTFVAGCAVADGELARTEQGAGKGKTVTLAAPTLTVISADERTVRIEVCAGADGAPGGFAVQWMPAAQLLESGEWTQDGEGLCDAGFSGSSGKKSPYLLKPYQCIEVDVGAPWELIPEENLDPCAYGLVGGDEYAFRAFAQATSPSVKSDRSSEVFGATLLPEPEPQTDEPQTDEPQTDEPQTDEPQTDEPQTDEPQTDEP